MQLLVFKNEQTNSHGLKKYVQHLNALCPKMAKTHLRNLVASATRFSKYV